MNENQITEQKKGKTSTIIIILLILIIIGLCTYIAYDKGCLNKWLGREENKEVEQKQEENLVKEITDKTIQKKLEEKIWILETMGNYNHQNKSYLYEENRKASEMDEFTKISAITMSYQDDKNVQTTTTYEEYKALGQDVASESEEDFKGRYEGGEIYVLDGTKINELYKDIFGTEIKNYAVNEDRVVCPMHYYNETANKYYLIYSCGGIGGDQSISYNYKYEEDNDNVYVYTAVGTESMDEGQYIIYTDYRATKKYKTESKAKEFQIDASNYKEFDHYKLTFTKNAGNYYFYSIEKVE